VTAFNLAGLARMLPGGHPPVAVDGSATNAGPDAVDRDVRNEDLSADDNEKTEGLPVLDPAVRWRYVPRERTVRSERSWIRIPSS
jgi:hypothetical protein